MYIKDQFASSPAVEEFRNLTVGTSGSFTQFITGTSLMFYFKGRPGNTGNIFYTNDGNGTAYVTLEAGGISPWLPGNRIDHYYWGGEVPGDVLEVHILK
jgi:hypothetical protein